MSSGAIKAWMLVHKWTSLVCTVFLLMLCLTGLPLIFHEEIDRAGAGKTWLTGDLAAPRLSLDAVLAKALARHPGDVPLYLSFDDERPVVYVTTAPTPRAKDREMHFGPVDWRTGQALPPKPGDKVMDFILQLHADMFLGLGGGLFLGAMGLLFVAAIVSGVVIYAPFMAKLDFGAIRRTRRLRARWTDYHNLLGVTTVVWATVVGLTGTINTLATPLTDAWRQAELGATSALARGALPPNQALRPQAAIQAAEAAAPGTKPQFIAFPGTPYSSNHQIAVYLQGATPATEKLLTPALVDATSGRLDALRPMPWYMKALFLSEPLHYGDYGGLPMKLLWALLDLATIVVLGSGLYLWLGAGAAARPRRRPAGGAAQARPS